MECTISQSTLMWVKDEWGAQTLSGHICTLTSKLLFQLGSSEPQETISAWQDRQYQRLSTEETHTHTHPQHKTHGMPNKPYQSGERHRPHTGNYLAVGLTVHCYSNWKQPKFETWAHFSAPGWMCLISVHEHWGRKAELLGMHWKISRVSDLLTDYGPENAVLDSA